MYLQQEENGFSTCPINREYLPVSSSVSHDQFTILFCNISPEASLRKYEQCEEWLRYIRALMALLPCSVRVLLIVQWLHITCLIICITLVPRKLKDLHFAGQCVQTCNKDCPYFRKIIMYLTNKMQSDDKTDK